MKRKKILHGGNIFRSIKNRWKRASPKTKRIIKGITGVAAGLAALYGTHRAAKHLGVIKYPDETNASFGRRQQYWKDKANITLGKPIGPAIPGPYMRQRYLTARKPNPPAPAYVSQILL